MLSTRRNRIGWPKPSATSRGPLDGCAQQQCLSRAGDGISHHRSRQLLLHGVPLRTKVSKPEKPPGSAAPAILSRRKNGLHIAPVIFYTNSVHYLSYVNYAYCDIL
jgi:hypothetical protein